MASKGKEAEYRGAKLTVQQMREAIPKIDRRLEELRIFDASSVNKYGDPKVQTLEQKVDSFLVSTFGSDSLEYQRYRRGMHIMPMTFWTEMSIFEVQEGVKEGIASVITQLEGIKSLFLEEIENTPNAPVVLPIVELGSDVFVVHGHDESLKNQVARLIESLGLKPIILHEQPNGGNTIIEKFEAHSAKAGFAIILLTPDDIGGPTKDSGAQKTRARQNVIFEHGYFSGKLGRSRVCALYVDNIELPSDLSGVLYIKYDNSGGWKYQLAKEMRAAGLPIDLNRVN